MKQPELGQKLIELRQQRNMTQEELVEACNVSVRTIQRIESGEVDTSAIYSENITISIGDRYRRIQRKDQTHKIS